MKPKYTPIERPGTSPYSNAKFKQQQSTLKKTDDSDRKILSSTRNINDEKPDIDYKERIAQLAKQNAELQTKQLRYIEKLRKLEEGLENQYVQSMKLQQLYGKLLEGYKKKEQQIRYREFQESSRKRDTQVDYQAIIDALKSENEHLQHSFDEQHKKCFQLEELLNESKSIVDKHNNECTQNNRLLTQLKQKQRIEEKVNNGTNIRIIGELTSMQQKVNNLRQSHIKLEYQNQYLKNRNKDLELYRADIDKMVTNKQAEIQKLREEKLALLKNDTDRKIGFSPRGSTQSPRYDEDRSKTIFFENKHLKSEIQEYKSEIMKLNRTLSVQREKIYDLQALIGGSNDDKHKHNDFFSFSKDEHQDQVKTSSDQQRKVNNWLMQQNQRLMKIIQMKQDNEQLPPFPEQLQIENLIKNLDHRKQQQPEAEWEVPQN